MIGTNLKFQKNQKEKSSCAISYFFIFLGQFWASGNSTPGPSEAEKLIGSGKKKKKEPLPPEERFSELIQTMFLSRTDDVSQGLCLSTFKKKLHLWKPEAY